MVPSLLIGLSLLARPPDSPETLGVAPPDEAEVALEVGAAAPPPVPATPTIRERQLAQAEGVGGLPPALVPNLSAFPSLAIIDLDEPANAWVPALSGGLFAFLGAQQVALADQRVRGAGVPQFGPPLDRPDWPPPGTRVDPSTQRMAGWAGVGFGIGAIVGSAVVYRWGEDAPFRVEPFAGPTGGGIGLSTRF